MIITKLKQKEHLTVTAVAANHHPLFLVASPDLLLLPLDNLVHRRRERERDYTFWIEITPLDTTLGSAISYIELL